MYCNQDENRRGVVPIKTKETKQGTNEGEQKYRENYTRMEQNINVTHYKNYIFEKKKIVKQIGNLLK